MQNCQLLQKDDLALYDEKNKRWTEPRIEVKEIDSFICEYDWTTAKNVQKLSEIPLCLWWWEKEEGSKPTSAISKNMLSSLYFSKHWRFFRTDVRRSSD